MSNIQLLKKAFQFFKPFKWPMVLVVTLILVQNILYSSSSYVLGKAIDAATVSDFALVAYLFAAYVIFAQALPNFLSRLRYRYELWNTDFKLVDHIQKESLVKSLGLSLGQLRREHSGFKQEVLKGGSSAISYFYDIITDNVFPVIASLGVALVGLYFIDIRIFFITIIFATLYIWHRAYMSKSIREPQMRIRKIRAELNKTHIDILRSLFFIKFANQKKAAVGHLSKVQDSLRDLGTKTWDKFHRMAIVTDIMFVLYYSICMYLIYQGLVAESISIGLVFPIFSWMRSIGNSIEQIQSIQHRGAIALSDLEKMFEMLEQETDVPVGANARSVKTFDDKIIFDSVDFDYDEGKKGALQGIAFDIKKGEKIALVGRSGSGKTTIVSLLLRLYDPTKGSITVDRVELKALELSDWHDMLAYVPQDGDLLDISIRDNILFGAKHQVTEPEIEAVLDKAGIREFIHNLPQGLDTLVGERGVKLSGGQKQRVCIARALIKDAPILLLDEATSSLDSETESVVNKAIWEMLGDKTGVVIAHRLSTILDADKIVVMDHGQIVGVGTHDDLLKTTPYYKTLVDAQNINL